MARTDPTIPGTAAHLRNWARTRGLYVGSRGVLPAKVVADYNAAHPDTPYRA